MFYNNYLKVFPDKINMLKTLFVSRNNLFGDIYSRMSGK